MRQWREPGDYTQRGSHGPKSGISDAVVPDFGQAAQSAPNIPPHIPGDGRDRLRPEEPGGLGPAVLHRGSSGHQALEPDSWLPSGLQSQGSAQEEWLRVSALPSSQHKLPQRPAVPGDGALQVQGGQEKAQGEVWGRLTYV